MRYLILGAGSLGTITGALATKAGYDVTLCDANIAHVDALNNNGAKLVGYLNETINVKAITPSELSGIYDVVFVLTKQTHNPVALPPLLKHLDDNSVVVACQNGVPEPDVAKYIGEKRVIGCTVDWGATYIAPGISELTNPVENMTFKVGELDGSIKDRTKLIEDFLNHVGKAGIITNLASNRWTKLLVNAAMSGMSAALGCTYGDVLDNDLAITAAVHIGNETVRVANAKGIELIHWQEHDFKHLTFNTLEEREEMKKRYKVIFGKHRALKASMLQDLEKKAATEVDAILGVVSNGGKETGIETPVTDQVMIIIKGLEKSNRAFDFETVNEILFPTI